MRKFFGVLTACVTMSLGACSQSSQFKKAIQPLATPIAAELTASLNDPAVPAATRDRGLTITSTFTAAVEAADQPAVLKAWQAQEDGPGVRGMYSNYLSTDPFYKRSGGDILRSIKIHNIATVDYILAKGTPSK